jgi:hypothetical protein
MQGIAARRYSALADKTHALACEICQTSVQMQGAVAPPYFYCNRNLPRRYKSHDVNKTHDVNKLR